MNMALTAIKKESIGEQVLAQMKEQILNGEWKEGMKIPSENQLCDTFGVSRVTVRQAIQKLVAQGLVSRIVGERLGISPRTAELHRSHAMKKLSASSPEHLKNILKSAGAI